MSASNELTAALAAIRVLDPADFSALKSWLSGDGRKSLRDRGAADDQIGAMRVGTDKLGDAPLG